MQEGTISAPGFLEVTIPPAPDSRGDAYAANCPARQLLDRISDKWSLLILLLLASENLRFSALKRRIQGVSQKMLSQTLRSLERDGLVRRDATPTVPVTVTYSITPLGRSLITACRSMIDWAETCIFKVTAAQAAYDARR